MKHVNAQINDQDLAFWKRHVPRYAAPDPWGSYLHIDATYGMLKCAIYVHDIGPDGGPFCYVRGSQYAEDRLVRRHGPPHQRFQRLFRPPPEARKSSWRCRRSCARRLTSAATMPTTHPTCQPCAKDISAATSNYGNCVLFDGNGIHRGGMVNKGERRVHLHPSRGNLRRSLSADSESAFSASRRELVRRSEIFRQFGSRILIRSTAAQRAVLADNCEIDLASAPSSERMWPSSTSYTAKPASRSSARCRRIAECHAASASSWSRVSCRSISLDRDPSPLSTSISAPGVSTLRTPDAQFLRQHEFEPAHRRLPRFARPLPCLRPVRKARPEISS